MIYKRYEVICDNCGERGIFSCCNNEADVIRKLEKLGGSTRIDGKNYCPDCTQIKSWEK